MILLYMLQFFFGLIISMIRSAFTAIWLFLFGPPVGTVACVHCSIQMQFHNEITLKGSSLVSSVVWSQDGKYLAVGHFQESLIDVYDTKTWGLVGSVIGDAYSYNSLVRFVDNDENLLMPLTTGETQATPLPLNDYGVSLVKWNIFQGAVSQKYYASAEYDKSSFNSKGYQPPGFQGRTSTAGAVAVSADGQYVAAAIQTGVVIYNQSDSRVIQSIKCEFQYGTTSNTFYNAPESIAFSPDSKEIAVGNCNRNHISVYNVSSGALIYLTPPIYADTYNVIAYNADGSLIAVGMSDIDDGKLAIIRATDGAVLGYSQSEEATISNINGFRVVIWFLHLIMLYLERTGTRVVL